MFLEAPLKTADGGGEAAAVLTTDTFVRVAVLVAGVSSCKSVYARRRAAVPVTLVTTDAVADS